MKPLTLTEIDRLGELLASVPDPFVPMEADQLDGFLTALCLLKVPPSIDDWFIYVLDASGNRRAKLADPAEHAELRRLVLARALTSSRAFCMKSLSIPSSTTRTLMRTIPKANWPRSHPLPMVLPLPAVCGRNL